MPQLLDFVRRKRAGPWRDGDNIPWHDPEFSKRMLAEHLTQRHDRASRRFETIDAHVEWIHEHVLDGRAAKVLDLGCGPGLYTSRLARLGHHCVGIDYSPASIAYAEDEARKDKLLCEYTCEDIREAQFGEGFDLVMLINGEFNTLRPAEAEAVLRKTRSALADGGAFLLESHTFEAVQAIRTRPSFWYSAERGLFSDRPHLYLQEHSWDLATNTATVRYFIVDAATGDVATYATTQQAYSDAEYRALLVDCGFSQLEFVAALTGANGETQDGLIAIVARK